MRSFNKSLSYQNPLRIKFSDEFFKAIPERPGVYFMLCPKGQVLYIGKAKSLRSRLSSYRNAKPGTVAENVIELLEDVSSIRWEERKTEEDAIRREAELLHAIRPPFNIAGVEEEHYLFVGIRPEEIPNKKSPSHLKLSFRLTSREEEAGYQLFGCYKHRRRVKSGYTALIRLIYAATNQKARFSFPARITRASPPYNYSMSFPKAWLPELKQFFEGRNVNLLRNIMQTLLANESIPQFMYPSLQEDLEIVQDFFKLGPQETRRLKRGMGLRTEIVTHSHMDGLISFELDQSDALRA